MKKLFYLLLLASGLASCEDVIEVDLPNTETRLVVDGIVRVDRSQEFVPLVIKVAESSNFFENNQPAQLDDNAIIYYGQPNPDAPEILENIKSSSLTALEPGSGIYVPDPSFDTDQRIRTANILPNTVFVLLMQHKGRTYSAKTPFVPTVPIDALEQGDETVFDEEDIELKITFTDVQGEDNYYVFDFDDGEFIAIDDQFIDGQVFQFSSFLDREIPAGDELTVSILGADQGFYSYMDQIIEQAEDDGGVFDTPIATVRGNVFDITGLDNNILFDNVNRPEAFPLGYFAVVETFKQTITIE